MSTMRPAGLECDLRTLPAENHYAGSMGIAAHSAGIGIGIIGFCGRLKESNRQMNRLTGLSNNELLGKELASLCAEDFRLELYDMLQELVMGLSAEFDLEILLKRSDEQQLWVHLTGNLIPGTEDIVLTMHDSSDYMELLQDQDELSWTG